MPSLAHILRTDALQGVSLTGCGLSALSKLNGSATLTVVNPSSVVSNSNGSGTLTTPCSVTSNSNGSATLTVDSLTEED